MTTAEEHVEEIDGLNTVLDRLSLELEDIKTRINDYKSALELAYVRKAIDEPGNKLISSEKKIALVVNERLVEDEHYQGMLTEERDLKFRVGLHKRVAEYHVRMYQIRLAEMQQASLYHVTVDQGCALDKINKDMMER